MKCRSLFALLACAVITCVSGCATHPPKPSEVTAVPTERIISASITDSPKASITFTSDERWGSDSCYIAISINGILAAKIKSGERVSIGVPDGQNVIHAIRGGGGLCEMVRSMEGGRSIVILIPEGHTAKVRIASSSQNSINLIVQSV